MPVHFLNRLGTNPRLAVGVPFGGQTPKRHTHPTHQMGPIPPSTRTTPLRRKGASRLSPGQAPRHARLTTKHLSKKNVCVDLSARKDRNETLPESRAQTKCLCPPKDRPQSKHGMASFLELCTLDLHHPGK